MDITHLSHLLNDLSWLEMLGKKHYQKMKMIHPDIDPIIWNLYLILRWKSSLLRYSIVIGQEQATFSYFFKDRSIRMYMSCLKDGYYCSYDPGLSILRR